ncbi:MAG: hypothetical protein IBX55_22470, partial [Methyloprofundus sp.]|nr:hypothetical protein [Methyloprofundus sp.]
MSDFPRDKSALKALISQAQTRDQFRLKRDLDKFDLSKLDPNNQAWLSWCGRLQRSIDKVQARKALVPNIQYDTALPVVGRR